MSTVIKPKFSTTPSAIPTVGDLVEGEVALNIVDGRLFVRDNAANVVEVGLNPAGAVTLNSVDINGGSIDGTVIGANDPTTASFISASIVSVDIDGGSIDNTTIGATTPAAGNFSTVDIDGGTIDGVTIATSTATLTSLTATTADINGGTIDGTAIGATSASTGDFTTLGATGAGTVGGDFTVDTTTLHVDSTNNRVGIGTISPAQLVEVAGSGALVQITDTSPSTGATLRMKSTAIGSAKLQFNNGTSDQGRIVYDMGSDVMTFSTANVARMSVNGDGSVKGLFSVSGTHNANGQFVVLTQAQYDALTPDADTIYFING